jgi:hypothetical protein
MNRMGTVNNLKAMSTLGGTMPANL